jgi:general stress protein 26
MPGPAEIEARLWKALKSDRTVMLGLVGREDGHTRPMTAQLEGDDGPLWFFSAQDNALVQQLGGGSARAVCSFASKGHDLFAALHGTLQVEADRSLIARLWNPFVAAWYDGKDDPKIELLRLDADDGQVWVDASSLVAGIKMLLGRDPKEDYGDKVAKVDLSY